ncbi:MAG: hypothetical protein JO057_18840 [Chloroflexi bacterium]|nr:hypothetical protein [Chloroflexota bacterium]
MLSYIAYLVAEESTRRQFDVLTSPGATRPGSLSWRLSARVWAQPLAATLRGLAERLEAIADPSELEPGARHRAIAGAPR